MQSATGNSRKILSDNGKKPDRNIKFFNFKENSKNVNETINYLSENGGINSHTR